MYFLIQPVAPIIFWPMKGPSSPSIDHAQWTPSTKLASRICKTPAFLTDSYRPSLSVIAGVQIGCRCPCHSRSLAVAPSARPKMALDRDSPFRFTAVHAHSFPAHVILSKTRPVETKVLVYSRCQHKLETKISSIALYASLYLQIS